MIKNWLLSLIYNNQAMKMRLNLIKTVLTLGLLGGLAACQTLDLNNRTVRQGNLSTVNTINKVKVGMSKEQVANLMGNSLISPLFRQDRWDYVNTRKSPRSKMKLHSASIYFQNGRVVKVTNN
jgi:outer membrane protein assembly factor BamE